ncbi:3-hydroxy-fatty acyl-ACP dehydratase [Tatumella sp. UBA2305]|uniref:ApeP family dehydratase n=1 Tax=Tatumella sp. UBA2305 TaxID=1947647 RepID=UPI0025F274BE|nr:3-hydroxy-fatty acyl-ACP dehydratase [Tatumella sp. UBA2305]
MSDYLAPGDYLPHQAPMILLEKVISVSEQHAHCQVTVSATGVLAPFLTADGELPGWFALELMAQSVGVWNGWHNASQQQETVSMGMILGARQLTTASPQFTANAVLDIHTTLLMQDGRVGSFDAVILSAGDEVASGRVNTYQPNQADLAQLFK